MPFELNEYHHGLSDDSLIEDLRHIAKKLDKNTLTTNEYEQSGGKYGKNTYIRHFGSWNKSLEKANLKIENLQNIPDKKLFENIELIWIKLGRQPKYGEIEKPLSRYSLGTYERRVGGWRKALESFVKFANSEQKCHIKKRLYQNGRAKRIQQNAVVP